MKRSHVTALGDKRYTRYKSCGAQYYVMRPSRGKDPLKSDFIDSVIRKLSSPKGKQSQHASYQP